MISVPLTLRFFVASGTAAVLVGCSSGGGASSDATQPKPTTPAASTSGPTPTDDAGKQAYLDAVNALCDALLPEVMKATHGGSTDVPAAEWVKTWPAHKALLDGFDSDLAAIAVPREAVAPAKVMSAYVVWATG